MYEIDVRRWGRSVVKVRVPREADATSREGDQMVEEAQGTQREKRHADQKLWELRVRGEWRRALADVEVLTKSSSERHKKANRTFLKGSVWGEKLASD